MANTDAVRSNMDAAWSRRLLDRAMELAERVRADLKPRRQPKC